jgi:uncharacterized membrane protein YciS (DUF1049 family)
MRRARLIAAGLVAPMIVALFIVATSIPAMRQIPWFYTFAYLLAQGMFWLALLLALPIVNALGVTALRLQVLAYGLAMFAVSCAGYAATYLIVGGPFMWLYLARDSIGLALSGVASFLLYKASCQSNRRATEVLGA